MSVVNSQTDNVSVRVIALAHATNHNEDVYLVVNLDTTVSQLKLRLQEHLSNHPRPEAQRLIYQGRPLTDGNVALRQILRLETTANDPPAHVLHLVVRDDQSSIPVTAGRPQSAPVQAPPENNHNPNSNHPVSGLIPPAMGLAQQALPPGHPAHDMLQNVLQQHMAIHNQHVNQRLPEGHQMHLPMPGLNLPNFQGMPGVAPQAPRPASQQDISAQQIVPDRANNASSPQNSNINDPPNVFQTSMTMRVQETIGPNGERIRRVVHQGPTLPVPVNPVERSASAPGAPAQHAGTTIPSPGIHHPGIHHLQGLHAPQLPHLSHFPTSPHPPQPPHLPHLQHFQPPFGRLPHVPPSSTQLNPTPTVRNPTLYLLSSSTGPEALLFAPNHGFFSSQQTAPMQLANHLPAQTSTSNNDNSHGPQQPAPTPTAPQTRGAARVNDQGQIAVRQPPAPQGPAQAPAQAQAQGNRREGEDLVALVLQRGWLFLRLYMFIFVLSEPGTWRRYILLTIASLVCLLPRNNPFTDLFQAARRHFDNLIGPPQAPTRHEQPVPGQQPLAAQNQRSGSDRPTNQSSTPAQQGSVGQMPTPEEHARRLLRNHEERNPNVIRDVIYRVEQGIALFLASLIPGVGERHVRAREEARRIVQEEGERQRREAEESARQQSEDSMPKVEGASAQSSDFTSATSADSGAVASGVDATTANTATASADGEGLRLRAGDGQR